VVGGRDGLGAIFGAALVALILCADEITALACAVSAVKAEELTIKRGVTALVAERFSRAAAAETIDDLVGSTADRCRVAFDCRRVTAPFAVSGSLSVLVALNVVTVRRAVRLWR